MYHHAEVAFNKLFRDNLVERDKYAKMSPKERADYRKDLNMQILEIAEEELKKSEAIRVAEKEASLDEASAVTAIREEIKLKDLQSFDSFTATLLKRFVKQEKERLEKLAGAEQAKEIEKLRIKASEQAKKMVDELNI